MTDILWQSAISHLAVYRYQGADHTPIRSQTPVLMLHGPMTSHRTWDTLAGYLWAHGMGDLYAPDMDDAQIQNQTQTTDYLTRVVHWILDQYPEGTRLVLIGHSTGGVLARRFVMKSEAASRVVYQFSLASPHHRVHFTHPIYMASDDDVSGSRSTPTGMKVAQPRVISPEIFMLNLFGNAVGPDFDGTVRGVYLPDAVNVVMPVGHVHFKQHQRVFEEIVACLRGERHRLQLHLQGLHMRGADQDEKVGPFCFEVNGMRFPSDGVFLTNAEENYTFDVNHTPLATLSYPDEQALVSVLVRLKDLSRARNVRRRLFAKLLVSIGQDVSAVHELQDSLGSKIILRVRTQPMPCVLR